MIYALSLKMGKVMIKAELINHMGSDLTIVNAARVSFDKASIWDIETILDDSEEDGFYHVKSLQEGDKRLISYLAKHNHFTPFTHAVITLRETVPIFVARQRFKHTVGFTYNEVSRRYVDDAPEFYLPDSWRERAENKKQGSGGNHLKSEMWSDVISETYRQLLSTYNTMIRDGVAPEQARMILPQSMMTSYYVTGSLAAFSRAYQLRSSEDSQYEIRLLADEWASIIAPLFPISWNALTKKD